MTFYFHFFRVLSINAVLGSALTILHECIPKICEVRWLNTRTKHFIASLQEILALEIKQFQNFSGCFNSDKKSLNDQGL